MSKQLLNVLIVEDSPADAELLIWEIKRECYEVSFKRVETAGGLEAALKTGEWDVIFSDYEMPEFSAPEAIDIYKASGLDIPFILVSGTIGEETAVLAMKSGAHDFLVKGKLARLVPVMERELREARRRKEKQKSDAALREAEERFRQITETIDEVFWIADPTITRMIYVSPAFERVWGIPCADLYLNPKMFVDAIHPDDHERVIAELRAQADGTAFDHEYRIVRPDGVQRWIWDRGIPVRYENSMVGRYVGVAVDITDRKIAEAENARLALVVNSSDDAIFSLTRDERIDTWNAGAERLFGYTTAQAKDQHLSLLISEKQRHDFEENLKKVQNGEPLVRYQHESQTKTGKKIYVSMTLSPIKNPNEEVVGIAGIARDVSELVQLEGQLRQAQKMEAVGRLAGGIAHDFNNLLTIINGYSTTLLEDRDLKFKHRDAVVEIGKAGDRASTLTRQLLAFSRQQVLMPQVVDLNALAAEMEKMLRRLIGEDISLQLIQEPRLGKVKADPGQLDQILLNLAINARDAMPAGGRLTIETGNSEFDETYSDKRPFIAKGQYVMLAVTDNGVGMDEETKARIFEPFFTTKGLGKGTGLGLAMVYGTVRQSGGFISVYSEMGKGTTFKIYLPRVEEPDSSDTALQAKSLRQPSSRGETILLLEDEESVRSLAARILKADGYKVIAVGNPEEAIQFGENSEIEVDLLLTDVVLPRITGPVVAQKILTTRPTLRVLFMSGYAGDAAMRGTLIEENSKFVQKPFTAIGLAKKVREVLDMASA